jgi:hypothetical protein
MNSRPPPPERAMAPQQLRSRHLYFKRVGPRDRRDHGEPFGYLDGPDSKDRQIGNCAQFCTKSVCQLGYRALRPT